MIPSPRLRILSISILLICLVLSVTACKVIPESQQSEGTIKLPQAKTLSNSTWIAIDRAMQKAISKHEDVLAYTIYRVAIDDIKFSSDKNLAVVWTSLVDKKTGEVQSAEPGLVIAHKDTSGKWSVVLQADSTFAAELKALPSSLISEEERSQFAPAIQPVSKAGVVYRGYKLPWPAGQSKRVTGSIGHFLTYKSCPSTCRYAYDFADGTMFALVAAKAGTVKFAEWRYPNGNTTNTNYLVLEDTTTTPTTYQVYYHLAQNSIPQALRVIGTKVYQGQFIGNVDDTGASTGNHLHFMVHTNTNSVWGSSVDIVFEDVTVNGGRPRTCSEAENFPEYGTGCMPGNLYTSQNGDNEVPTGGITTPANNSTITSEAINVEGWMKDDVGVDHAQLMYTVDENWLPVGPVLNGNSFSTAMDLCELKIPNGKFSLSLVVTDVAGKTSAAKTGLTTLTKNYKCPVAPPTCVPAANQAALYLMEDFQGNCQILDIGKYEDLDKLTVVKSDQTRSIKLGSGVSVLLYPEKNFGGTLDFFQTSDGNLSNNPIGMNSVSSVEVLPHVQPPAAPRLTLPQEASSTDTLTLAWTVEAGVTTNADLTGPNNFSAHLDWQDKGTWEVGTLPAGDYSLTVNARNLAGTAKVSQGFSVTQAVILPVVTLDDLPALSNNTAIRLNWKVESGAASIDHFEIQVRSDDKDWETWSNKPGSDARTTVYTGKAGSTLHFRMRGVTASGKALEFATIPEVSTKLNEFCTGDKYEGSDPGDDKRDSAAPITMGDVQQHNWCQAGDLDWVAFQATKGQVLGFATSAVGLNSAAVMRLYNSDGITLLGEAHPADANSSAALEWTVPADGVYYIRLSPEDTLVAGDEAIYTFKATVNNDVNPAVLVCGSITIPAVLGSGFLVAKKKYDKKKASKRAGWK